MSEHLEVGARYVVGFCFNEARSHVLLIRKKRPTWQAGKLNGVGGKVEISESCVSAMEREFIEETGACCLSWELFAVLEDKRGWAIWFYRAFVLSELDLVETPATNDERLEPVFVEGVKRRDDIVENLKWLLPMALGNEKLIFEINEVERA